jgi:hypothetical protein
MQVTAAEALCQEFCDSVSVVVERRSIVEGVESSEERRGLEIKCRLDRKFFGELVTRMVDLGYCCPQVQQDAVANKCVAWFEEADNER